MRLNIFRHFVKAMQAFLENSEILKKKFRFLKTVSEKIQRTIKDSFEFRKKFRELSKTVLSSEKHSDSYKRQF